MSTLTAEYACSRFSELQSSRSPWEAKIRQVSEAMRPLRTEFRSVYDSGTLPPQQNPYITNSTSQYALDNFVGGIYTYLSNEANAWCELQTFDDDLNKWSEAKYWLASASRIVLNSYGPAFSGFYSQVPDLYADTSGLGTGCFNTEWMPGNDQIYDICYSPLDVYYDIDNWNRVDTCYRPFWFSKRQIKQKWPDLELPDTVKNAPDHQKFQLIHVVTANDEYVEGRIGPNGFPFSDLYFMYDHKFELQRGGRYEFYQAPRWAGNGTYGFGLGMRALPDDKTLQAMDRSMLENAELMNHPPVLMPDRNALQMTRPQPRKPVYGGMSMGGKPMAQYLETSGRINITFEMMKAREEQIREGFFFSLMQLSGRTGLAPVEFLARDEEKMRRLGPYLARLQREFLSPSVSQRFAMLWRAGQIPPPPRELANQKMKIKYSSPMANAQKSAQAAAALRLVDGTLLLAKVQPDVIDTLDTEDVIRTMQEGFGAPATNVRPPDVVKQLREQRQQLMQAQAALTLGQQGADIANKLGVEVGMQRNGGKKAA